MMLMMAIGDSDRDAGDGHELPDLTKTTVNLTLDNMMDAEKEREEALRMQDELKHSVWIFYTVLIVMIVSQSLLVRWRKHHRRSYELVTLIGLWLVPAIISIQLVFWKFLIVWSAYSIVTGMYLYKCTFADALWDTSVPKNVYKWFLGVFRTSVYVGLTGYIVLLVDILSGGILLAPLVESGFSLLLIWYGLYFGILTRDCAEVISDRMVGNCMKFNMSRKAASIRDCALCGVELSDSFMNITEGIPNENNSSKNDDTTSIQLQSCKHVFHPECIKGWLIVGKKDSCPACNEKVDLRVLCANKPWETRNLSWIQMLDMVRYMIVWQPTIMTGLHFLFHMLKWDDVGDIQDQHAVSNNSTINSTSDVFM